MSHKRARQRPRPGFSLPSCSFKHQAALMLSEMGADQTLHTFIKLEGLFGQFVCPWSISTQWTVTLVLTPGFMCYQWAFPSAARPYWAVFCVWCITRSWLKGDAIFFFYCCSSCFSSRILVTLCPSDQNYQEPPAKCEWCSQGLPCGFLVTSRGFPGGSMIKNLPATAGGIGLIPDPRRWHMLRGN